MIDGVKKLPNRVVVSRLSSPIKSSTPSSQEHDADQSLRTVKKQNLYPDKSLGEDRHKENMKRRTEKVKASTRRMENRVSRMPERTPKFTQRAQELTDNGS